MNSLTYHWNNHAQVYFCKELGHFVSLYNDLYQFKSNIFPDLHHVDEENINSYDIDQEIKMMQQFEPLKKASILVLEQETKELISLKNIELILSSLGFEVKSKVFSQCIQGVSVLYDACSISMLYIHGNLFIFKSDLKDIVGELYLSNHPILQFIENNNIKLKKPIRISRSLFEQIQNTKLIEEAVDRVALSDEAIVLEVSLIELSKTEHLLPELVKEPFSLLSTAKSNLNLKSLPCKFNKDGGSRAIPPSETLDKLKPFISDKLGLVTHIEELKLTDKHPIKIFRTGFYKGIHTELGPHNPSFVQICLGKGVDPIQSKVSAVCEAIERKNAQFQGTEYYKFCKADELNERHVSFHALLPYSDNQYANFADSRSYDSKRKQAVLPHDSKPVNWFKVWSLTEQQHVYVPLVCCFANTPFEDKKYGFWHSNGCAAGNYLEEALLQGLFELIERDAIAIWWYNKINSPSYNILTQKNKYLSDLGDTINESHDFWVLNITNDIKVPVMAAIAKSKKDGGFIFGFGCHLSPEMAAQRALTELCQLIPIRDQNEAPFDFDAVLDESYLYPTTTEEKKDYLQTEGNNITDDLISIQNHLESQGFELLAFDYTRKISPIYTAKVFVPGLCHIWPQLGNKRLYDTPVRMGWRQETLNEQTINQQGLYI